MAIVLLLAACGQPEAAPQQPAQLPAGIAEQVPAPEAGEDALVVVFLGDSLTAGYGLEPGDALPEQVEAVWRRNGTHAVAVNAGVSGDTTAQGLARFDWSVTSAKPGLLVVALGANDYLLGVPPDVTRANLAAILDRAKQANIPAVLVGLSLRGEIADGSREAAFAAIYPGLAAEYGVPYYPSLLGLIEGDPSMLQADGLHPTRDGVVRIAAPLADFLTPVIEAIERPDTR
ncbi:MAG: arylesterase [Acidobacteria bacterium]|nr:arylesterase [Acidobacteriota bacterium]